MKVIIAGSRSFEYNSKIGYAMVNAAMSYLNSHYITKTITEVVCGEARGIDNYGKRWANDNGIPVASFPADWEHEGKAAGYIRNGRMADYADAAIIIWDGESKGSLGMVELMDEAKKPYILFEIKIKSRLVPTMERLTKHYAGI